MKVFAKRMIANKVEHVEVAQDLGVEILHNGLAFRLQLDNYGRLTLSSDGQLIVKPRSSNSFLLEQES